MYSHVHFYAQIQKRTNFFLDWGFALRVFSLLNISARFFTLANFASVLDSPGLTLFSTKKFVTKFSI
jgi:hypothetical protein